MARDQIEVDLLLNAKKAEATIKQMNRELSKMGKTMGQAFSGAGGGAGNKVRALGTGLSKATVRADEFSKSLEASNARVIAFGASAGLIMNVDRALRAMVKTTIQVEKAMADVNVVMNVSSKQLDQFGKGMFKVAKDTAQGFSTVAEASTELARQGLGMEKTLARTKDALILTRLTGMNAADAVKSLTAAVNSFTKEGTTSAQVINKMAKVDAAFAVSSEDLAKSISRVGSSAVDAGVSLDQLLAITTAVQQKTARGGAVIGNAFKTIFTRIQRTDVQQKLSNIGVATRDMQGNMLDAVTVLRNLSSEFQNLSKQQQANIAENVAGVFQVNVLRAALSDLGSEYSNYGRALKASSTATNEAYQRNEQLNKSLDSLVNRTLANLTQAGAALGGDLFGPTIKKLLGAVNTTLDAFGEGGKMEGFGQTIGKGLIKGIGSFISGPGLVAATAVFGKLALSLGKFATTAFKDIMGINTAVKQRAALEEIVVNTLASEPALLQKVKMGTLSVLDVERQILATIKQQQAERTALKGYGGAIAGSLHQRGTRVGSSGRAFSRGMGRASGFVPNFANANGERAAAAAGGYTAGAIKTMSQPGAGTMMYNSAETVKQFPGMSQKAIMPPKNSPAGAGYKSAFGAAHGFNPYAAEGFIPNFAAKRRARPARPASGKEFIYPASNLGVLGLGGSHSGTASTSFGKLSQFKNASQDVKNQRVKFTGMQVRTINAANKNLTVQSFSNDISRLMTDPVASLAHKVFSGVLGNDWSASVAKVKNQFGGKRQLLPPGAEGSIFEAAVNLGLKATRGGATIAKTFDQSSSSANKPFDFEEVGMAKPPFKRAFGFSDNLTYADAKRTINDENVRSIIKKAYNQGIPGLPQPTGLKRKKALGYVPNFSPLSSSITRERQAGIPASKIRVGSSPTLRSSGNPSGLGVYNTIDEPRGLNQGISRSRSMGINPKSHGAAEGFVPNFTYGIRNTGMKPIPGISGKSKKSEKADLDTAKNTGRMAKIMEGIKKNPEIASMGGFAAYTALTGSASMMGEKAGALGRIGGNMAMMAGTGAALAGPAAPLGAVVGAAVGALTSMGDIITLFSSDTSKTAEQLAKSAGIVNESLSQILGGVEALGNYDSMTAAQRITKLMEVEAKRSETLAYLTSQAGQEGANPIFQQLAKDLQKTLPSAAAAITKGDVGKDFLKKTMDQLANIKLQQESAVALQAFSQSKGGFGQFATTTAGLSSEYDITTKTFANKSKTAESQFLTNSLFGGASGLSSILQGTYRQGRYGMPQTGAKGMEGVAEIFESGNTSEGAKAFFNILDNLGKTGISKGFASSIKFDRDTGSFGGSIEDRVGAKFTLENMFKPGGAFGPDILKAATDPVKTPQPVARPDLGAALTSASRKSFRAMGRKRTADRKLIDLGREAASANKLAQAQNRYTLTIARATKDTIGLADETKKLADIEAQRIFEQDKSLAEAKKTAAEKSGKAAVRAGFESFLSSDNFSTSQQAEAKTELKRIIKLTPKEMEKELNTIKGVEAAGRTTGQKLALEILPEAIKNANKATEDFTTDMGNANAKLIDSNALSAIEERLQKKALELSRQLNTEKMKEVRITRDILAAKRVEDARVRVAAGQMSAREASSIYSDSIDAQIAARGVKSVNFNQVMGQTFKNEMSYNEVDAFGDFRDGVKDVAGTMKSSFADAFQSISSGATTVQGALANMAQSILSSINQMSTQIFTNMMFSKMFGNNSPGNFAKGGYVPGYAAGGLVTGGSGYKDDVLTKMQGGEFVIKKSAVNRIGIGKLNAINGYANGGSTGPSMGTMGLVAGVSGAATGILGAAMQDRPDKPLPSRNYGMGRGSLGYLGGADPDGGQIDRASGGGTSANVSLSKGFVYYRRDPETGRLVSERARPTEGRFEVSSALSLMGRLDEGDPQTSRMFDKEQRIANYQNYIAGEKASRRAQTQAVKDQKKSRLIGAYMNAAMLIGGAKLFGGGAGTAGGEEMMGPPDHLAPQGKGIPYRSGYTPHAPGDIGFMENQDSLYANGGRTNGSLARVMGGEYVMSPQAVRTHGVDFMTELNRGNVPRYASGGLVGNQTGGVATGGSGSAMSGNMTNNVKINVNIDKSGKAEASATADSQNGSESARGESEDVENNADLGKALQSVVIDELIKQQRPGGLLHSQN